MVAQFLKFYKFFKNFMITYIILIWFIVLIAQPCMMNYEYYDASTNSCKPCSYNCLTCFDANLCVTCVQEYYLDQTNNQCKLCPYGCAVCSSSTSCTSCKEGLYLNGDGNCLACSIGVKSCSIAVVQVCEDGYFMLGDICAGCIDNCDECSDFATCNKCSEGYYVSADTTQCLACSQNCLVCPDSLSCSSCKQGYEISGGICVSSDCSSISSSCIKCSFGICLECERGKYLNSNGLCSQGASILCLQATGPYHTNCETSNFGCPSYAIVQTDIFSGLQLDVCLPVHVSTLKQQNYHKNPSECAVQACNDAQSYKWMINNLKPFFKLKYYILIKFYKESSHTVTIQLVENTQAIAQSANTVDVASEFSENLIDSICSGSCAYGIKMIEGQLIGSASKFTPQINIQSATAGIVVLESMIVSEICTVENCQKCSSSVDCQQCEEPYYLQMISCVTICDPGFYKFGRTCVLQCPTVAYPILGTYECLNCVSPCETCTSETQCLTCVNNYYLEGTKCLLQCSTNEMFANSTSSKCEPCPNPCTKCKVETPADPTQWNVVCQACRIGYVLQDGACTYQCPEGNYADFVDQTSVCLVCLSQCSSCYLSENTCLSCTDTYLLNIQTNMCEISYTCPEGYYKNPVLNICQECHYPCKQCQISQSNCTSCLKGSLYQNQCPLKCPQTFYSEYQSNGESLCKACVSPCVTCLSQEICLTCNSTTFLYQAKCYTQCPSNILYKFNDNNTCLSCLPPCAQCISASDCLSCNTGFIDLSINKCLLQCNQSSYVNENFECTLCPTPCLQCYSSIICSRCDLPHVLHESNCISEVDCQNLNQYVLYNYDYSTGIPQHTSSLCVSCTYPCTSCQGSQILCTTCAATYYFVSELKTCVQKCPLSYFADNDVCSKCDSICLDCESTATNCIQCGTGMYLHEATCIGECPTLYYGDNVDASCKVCQSPCVECFNIYLCKSCEIGTILYNKVCIDECPKGSIHNTVTNQCDLCTDNCQTCSIQTSNCTSCVNEYYYYQHQCLSGCMDFYYPDSRSQTCEPCISPCNLCLSDIKCKTCVTGYYLLDDKCVLACPQGYFKDAETCKQCNKTICRTCQIDQNNCKSCISPYFFDSITSNKCVLNCPLTSYADTKTVTCKECVFPCTQCTNINICSTCHNDYKVFNSFCYSACPVGYYSTNDNKCQACLQNCEICQSNIVCLKCAVNYYVNNKGECVNNCGAGFFSSFQALTSYPICAECPRQCLQCSSEYSCSKCSTNLGYDLFLFNGLCLDECPIMHFAHQSLPSQYQCQSCPQNCNKCVNQTVCKECLSSYMYNNMCYSSCPVQTYLFNEEICIDCSMPCKECSGQFSCITCQMGYFYFQNYCLEGCPDDVWTYPENDSCLAQCPYNKYQEKKQCYVVGCGGTMVQLNGYCLEKCPENYYVDESQNCQQCSNSQEICDNLFQGFIAVLRSENLKLSIYFNQAIQTESLDTTLIEVTFSDLNDVNSLLDYPFKNITYDEFSLTIQYAYQQIDLYQVIVKTPYILSAETPQSLSSNYFESQIYSYNDYGDKKFNIVEALNVMGMVMVIMVFACVIINIIVKSSSFFQLLDFIQFIAATLYLQIQYPPNLEQYLRKLTYSLWSFSPSLINFTPYVQSPSKYIEYFTDTSFLRSQFLPFIIFIALFFISLVVILINQIKPECLDIAVKRIRYRHLNDLFGIFMFPLLLFSFHFINITTGDLIISLFLILISIGYLLLITYKLITAKSLDEIPGLTGDLEDIDSTLGKLYTPFAFIRKIIFAFVICIQPESPISTITILLVFTFLIMICLFFYQPFEDIRTDYICIFMEIVLVIYIIFLMLFALNAVTGYDAYLLALVVIIMTLIGFLIGLSWLIYLTYVAIRKYHASFAEKKSAQENLQQKKEYISEDNNNINEYSSSVLGANPNIIHVRTNNRVSLHSNLNSNQYEDEPSANMLVSKKNYGLDHESGGNEEFRHYHASDSDNNSESNNNQPPLYLMKIQK